MASSGEDQAELEGGEEFVTGLEGNSLTVERIWGSSNLEENPANHS